MSSIDRRGVAIHYEVHGDGGGTAVLLSHGYCATSHMYESTVAVLSTSRRCITWDIRGHGRSDYPDDADQYSVELSVGDMLAILDSEGVDRAVLIGHSMGGYLSLELQRSHPERVAALVLVGTGPGYRRDDTRAGWNDMCESFAAALEAKGVDGMPSVSDEVRASDHRSVDGLVHAARSILRQRDALVIEHLPDIDVPTLVVVGDRDRQFLAGGVYMATKIPGARHVVIEGAGHAPMLTHPDQFLTEVSAFLGSVDAAARK
jgi:pimeloyl-ACP methyl ester carboxylesterase